MRTHIFDVEVKDFLHECGGHRDHHDVAPVLTEGPHHNHPDIPEIIATKFQCQCALCMYVVLRQFLSYMLSLDTMYLHVC